MRKVIEGQEREDDASDASKVISRWKELVEKIT